MRNLLAILCFSVGAATTFAQTQVDASRQIKNLPYIDIRSYPYNAVGITTTAPASCKGSTIDDQPAIQAALYAAAAIGIPRVYVPGGFCWPIANHLFIPQGVILFGDGHRTIGYETSSMGSVIIANANYPANIPFPYGQMIWVSGDNYTYPAAVIAVNVTFGVEVTNLELNCAEVPACGNIYAIGRQEKSSFNYLLMTGVTTPTTSVNGGYVYSSYEQGVDCNGHSPGVNGCFITSAGAPGINPNSGQQGPDYHIEIFPSFTAEPTPGFWVPWALMGAANYQGLQNSTINGYYGSNTPYGMYFWGSQSTLGPIHVEGVTTGGVYIGPVPGASGACVGADHTTFFSIDTTSIITNCMAQQQLTFINQGAGGNTATPNSTTIVNLKNSTTITDNSYCFDAEALAVAGPCGIRAGLTIPSNIGINDPGEYVHTGYLGGDFYNGTPYSGLNFAQDNEGCTNDMRAYLAGSIHWVHTPTGCGTWQTGNNGGQDWSLLGFLNTGWVGISSAYNTNFATTNSNATVFSYINFLAGGASGHVLMGPGYVNPTTGIVTDSCGVEVCFNGGMKGDSLTLTGTLTVPSVASPYGQWTGTVPTTITAGSYISYSQAASGELDLISAGSGTGGINFYNSTGSAPGTLMGAWTPSGGLTINAGAITAPSGSIGSGTFGSLASGTLTLTGGIGGVTQTGGSSSTTCPTGTSAFSTCTFTITWPTPYATATYHPAGCMLIAPTGAPTIQGVTAINTNTMVVTVMNGQGTQAVASGAGSMNCWATP